MRRFVVGLFVCGALAAHVSGSVDASMPATFNVAGGDVSGLISAIQSANASPGADTINLSASTYTLVSSVDGHNGLPPITGDLTINGNGATIARSADPDTPDFRIAVVSSGTVSLTGLTVTNGRKDMGAGILNFGTLTVVESTLSGNNASLYGGGIFNWPGATLSVIRSAVIFNTADTFIPTGCHSCSYGGGINNWGSLTVANSTIANNMTGFSGGGIYSNGSVHIVNSTVALNASLNFAGGIAKDSGGTISAGNVILASNSSSSIGATNCSAVGGGFGSLGHNLSTDGTCTSFLTQPGDLHNTPAGLDPLGVQDNGGPTETIALMPGSAAIDTGSAALCSSAPVLGTDQRGASRPIGPGCDRGAFEAPLADEDPPAITCQAADGLWHATDVSLSCSASDTGSGLADSADASFTLSTSVGAGTETSSASTGSRTICDNAGNCATAGPVAGNKVDKKTPEITVAAPTATSYLLNQSVAAAFTCVDGGSGVASCAGTSANGAPIATAAAGSYVFTVNAVDGVGNAATTAVNYTVGYGVCVLFDQSKAHKTGSTIPIKLQLCDAAGANVSSASVPLVATAVYLVSNSAPGPLADSGNANPDYQFRFDIDKYIFNLSLNGFSEGTYALVFTAGSDPAQHTVQFQVK